jgi:phosphoribosylformylglycinamidine cyclo-ligase
MKPITYASAGVDIAAGDRAKKRIAALARGSFNRNVLAEIGGFGSLFALDRKRWRDPVLVASCDGVGTKLRVAFLTGRHDTIGQDLVNHCVNDIAVQGAEPLFFLDYLAVGKLEAGVAAGIVAGLARACRQNGLALVGGETAEMPGFYAPGEYDVAGFIVGAVDRSRILTGKQVRAGDLLVGLPSTGLHTNGYSLARRLLFDQAGLTVSSDVPELKGTVGDALLKIHRSYLAPIRELHRRGWLHAAAHITGGGFPGNLLRQVPKTCGAAVSLGSWPVPPLFSYLQKLGNVARDEMYRTFNMGIGMVLVIPAARLAAARALLRRLRERHYVIGQVVCGKHRGKHRVDYL